MLLMMLVLLLLPAIAFGQSVTPPAQPTNGSEVHTLAVAAKDTKAPEWEATSKVEATKISSSVVLLKWSKAKDNVAVAGYKVYVNGVEKKKTNTQSYTVTGLDSGKTYTFRIEAYDAAGNVSKNGPSVTPDWVAPKSTINLVEHKRTNKGYIIELLSTITATDNVDGTNVKQIQFKLNGSRTWREYTGPFVVEAKLVRSIEFRAIDNAGNEEKTWQYDFDAGRLTQ